MKKAIFIFFCFIETVAIAQFNFSKITDAEPTKVTGDWRSVNWVDYNNDGYIDLFVSQGPQGGANNALFRNNKNGTFTRITNDPIVSDNTPSDGATFADFDNDGHIDAFVANWYGVNNLLYKNNGNGSFSQILTGNLVTDGGYSETASWGDYDNDGFVDLYVANSDGDRKNFLYHNERNGTFSKITTGTPATDAFASRNVNWVDTDSDGKLDLFVTNETNQNENLYKNAGNGSFTKITNSPLVQHLGRTMSSSWGDMDNDGDLDVFLANDRGDNALFRNDGNNSFSLVNGIQSGDGGNSFGTQWGDLDNDGDLDLIVMNAFWGGPWANFAYLNDGSGGFTKVTEGAFVQELSWSYGCALGDYDKDGDLDIAVAGCLNASDNNRLYRNETTGKKWFQVKLTGTTTNKSAIGSIVRIRANVNGQTVWQMRDVSAQSGYCGQNQLDVHFGLGNASVIDSVIVQWASGRTDRFGNITPNRFYQITEGSSLVTSVNDPQNTPSVISTFSVAPNPAASVATVEFELLEAGSAELSLYDLSGKKVVTLANQNLGKGKHHFSIDKNQLGLSNGTYQVVLTIGGQSLSRKFVFVQ